LSCPRSPRAAAWSSRALRSGLSYSTILCSTLALGCSLLRPLEDLETSEGALRAQPCPDEMQEVRFEDGASFCIDKLETTRAQYDEFLSAPVPEASLVQQDSLLCPARESFEPGGGADCTSAYAFGVDAELPVACVDLCDAMAYCSFRGKRLCGGRGGETVDQDSVNSPTEDEWFVACAGESGRQYPYAPSFEPRLCNIDSAGLEPVSGSPGCETPEHVEQLSGNVSEWVLICKDFPRRKETRCLVRGGDYLTTDGSRAGCHQTPRDADSDQVPLGRPPSERSPGIGIRCCSD